MASESKLTVGLYFLLTGLIVLSQTASGVADITANAQIVEGLTNLGYPKYLIYILGPAKILGSLVLIIPGFLRLKEWAYAGFSIDFIGAFLSHMFNGDGFMQALPALIVFFILMGSYALRPASRTLAP